MLQMLRKRWGYEFHPQEPLLYYVELATDKTRFEYLNGADGNPSFIRALDLLSAKEFPFMYHMTVHSSMPTIITKGLIPGGSTKCEGRQENQIMMEDPTTWSGPL
eukprot:8933383-Karenia_brevis.AAC.1